MKTYVPCTDEEYWERLIKEAPYIEGWHSNTETLDDIEWLDLPLLEKSKDFFHKHRFTLAASTGIVALFGIPMKNVSLPFIQTATLSPNPVKTAKRTVKHVTHFVEWFTDGVANPRTYNDIQNIKPYTPPADETIPDREIHQQFLDAVSADFIEMNFENSFSHISRYDPEIYLSQFDMVMIQLDLIAGYILPEFHTIAKREAEEAMEGYLHHWAVIGRLLGIHDRYNLALNKVSRELCLRIARNVLALTPTMDLMLSTLMEAHCSAISAYCRVPLSPAGGLYALLSMYFPEFKGHNLYQLTSWWDRIIMGGIKGIFALALASDLAKGIVRKTVVKAFGIVSPGFHKLSREDRLKLPIEVMV
jgi:hypothetical protein